MKEKRFYINEELFENQKVFIDGEEFRHAINVLRIKEGEEIIACDNSGKEHVCKVSKINKKDFVAEVLSCRESITEAKTNVMLIAGYLKGDKTELVVQKAVELGLKEIVVFSSKFSSAFMNDNKLSRLNKVSIEAAKQCGRAIAPKVFYAENFEKALDYGKEYTNKFFACEFADKNDVDFSLLSGDTAIVVGSEGGFSKEEYESALSLGYKTIYLGKRILRAETASIVLSGIVMHSLKEME